MERTRFHVVIEPNFSDHRLRAAERLKSRKAIQSLFGGESLSAKAYPLRLVYRLEPRLAQALEGHPEGPPAQLGFVASKRGFRRAVDRNRLKRLMREAYRGGKPELYAWLAEREARLYGMLLYTGRGLPAQREVDKAWRKLLRRLDPAFFGA